MKTWQQDREAETQPPRASDRHWVWKCFFLILPPFFAIDYNKLVNLSTDDQQGLLSFLNYFRISKRMNSYLLRLFLSSKRSLSSSATSLGDVGELGLLN